MRPEITEERVGYSTQALRPGFQNWNVVNADAQDLGI
jgi:hypothetical protein